MLGIEDIIKNITCQSSQGQSRGVSASEVRAIWHALWCCVERLLAQGKSVVINNFATISIVSGPRDGSSPTSSSLSFALHPHFTSTHNITSPLDVKGPGSGSAVVTPLHAAFIEHELNGAVPRHAIQNSIKDTIRHIGLVAGTGKALRLDCNPVMTINFLNCRANVSFSGRLARVLPTPARAPSQQPQQQQQESSRELTPRSSRASSVTTGGVQQQQQQQQQFVPRPPSSSSSSSTTNHNNNNNNNDANAAGSSDAVHPAIATSRKVVNLQQLIASGRGGGKEASSATENISASRGTFSQASSAARAHNREQRMQLARDVVTEMPVSDYKKHMIKKNIYRHLRGEVYRNIWEQNQLDVSARRQAEAKADRELMDHLEAVAAHERSLLEQRDRDRRRTAMETRLLNQKLAPLQKAQQLPRIQDPGEIFYQRQNPLVLQKDTQTLMRQIQDRKMRDDMEREEDRKVAEEAHQEYLKVRQEHIDAKKKRQEAQVVLRSETERILHEKNLRHQQEVDQDRLMARKGGLFFEEGGNVFAERSRTIMRENVQLMRQRASESQRDRSEQLRNQGIEFRNQLVEDAAQAVAQRQHDQEIKETMRAAWHKQMSEKNARLRAEKKSRDTWRDRWNIQNSSSDDDE